MRGRLDQRIGTPCRSVCVGSRGDCQPHIVIRRFSRPVLHLWRLGVGLGEASWCSCTTGMQGRCQSKITWAMTEVNWMIASESREHQIEMRPALPSAGNRSPSFRLRKRRSPRLDGGLAPSGSGLGSPHNERTISRSLGGWDGKVAVNRELFPEEDLDFAGFDRREAVEIEVDRSLVDKRFVGKPDRSRRRASTSELGFGSVGRQFVKSVHNVVGRQFTE